MCGRGRSSAEVLTVVRFTAWVWWLPVAWSSTRSFELYDAFLSVLELETGREKLQRLRMVCSLLPETNRLVLQRILKLFGAIIDGCDQ
jgi:hypothetical protein